MTSLKTLRSFSSPQTTEKDPTLGTYATFVVTYRTLLVLAVIVGLAGGFAIHYSAPERYTSTAHMVIVATTVDGTPERQADVSIDSALQLLRSDQVIGSVAREINHPGGPSGLNDDVTTRPIINSRILRLSVAALDPAAAQRTAAAITDRFFDVRQQGLEVAALSRVAGVDAELAVVEAELESRYQLATEDDFLTRDESTLVETSPDTTGIRSLVTRRAQLHGERAFLEISAPNPGYLSRPPTEPLHGNRSGLAVKVASTATLSLLAAVALAVLHQTRPEHLGRGQHRPTRLARRRQ